MIISTRRDAFVSALHAIARADTDYWSYRRMGQRPGLHGLIRYPAMMVPQMQADLLATAASANLDLRHVLDPFVGSGTTMLESLKRGLSFEGYDINPLAILVCRAKLLSMTPEALNRKITLLLQRIKFDDCAKVDVDFPGRDKWFTVKASVQLSRIRRAIIDERSRTFRQFLWVILAETIRQTSLSRESTYKLHIRAAVEHSSVEEPDSCFTRLAMQAAERFAQHCNVKSVVTHKSSAKLVCEDIRKSKVRTPAQLLITSPPYGDNESTIPYGQFSYLALRWISEGDIEGDPSLLRSAYAIDTASLGGSCRSYVDRALAMMGVSKSFREFFEHLLHKCRPDLEAKAACFTADLFDAIGASLAKLEEGGLAVWTLGERRIGGLPVPLVQICSEINEFFGMVPVTSVSRRIYSKRMPHRNSQGATMATETILVMCKP